MTAFVFGGGRADSADPGRIYKKKGNVGDMAGMPDQPFADQSAGCEFYRQWPTQQLPCAGRIVAKFSGYSWQIDSPCVRRRWNLRCVDADLDAPGTGEVL